MFKWSKIFKIVGTVLLGITAAGIVAGLILYNNFGVGRGEDSTAPGENIEIVNNDLDNDEDADNDDINQIIEPIINSEEVIPVLEVQNDEDNATLADNESLIVESIEYSSELFPNIAFNYPSTWQIDETNEDSNDYDSLKEYILSISKGESGLTFRMVPALLGRCGGAIGVDQGSPITDFYNEYSTGNRVSYGTIATCPIGFWTPSTQSNAIDIEYNKMIEEADFLEEELRVSVYYDVYIDGQYTSDVDLEVIRDIIRTLKN